MTDNYLITGYHGKPHVTAENDRGFNAAVFGSGKFVLPVGEKFRAEYIGNNTVRVYDGKLLDGGALAGIPAGEYIDLVIPEAGQGMNRNDIIAFQYSQDTNTLVESGVFTVISGTETSGTPVDPALTENDILSGSATFDQMALYRVPVSGAVISDPVSLFEVSRNVKAVDPFANNLLRNSDFSNPVCSGTSGTSSYILDGWTANKLTITQEQYDIKTVPTATYAYIKQVVKVTPGKTYTCAARFSNAGVGEIRIYNTAITTQYGKVGKISAVGMVSFTVPDDVKEIAVLLYPNAANVNSGIVYWAALYEGEYTAETIPEYKTRGYSMEAAVCGYPVGAIYMSVNSESPASLFGGTWEQLKDRFLLGAGSTYSNGATGGAATHTLTVAQMPSHSHGVSYEEIGEAYNSGTRRRTLAGTNNGWATSSVGRGQAHNNMPPYLVVYMWKRVS